MTQGGKRGRPAGVDGEQTRRRIMFVAAEYVAEVGYANATMKDIAGRAGITGAAIYRYFPSKKELVAATLDETMNSILSRLDLATQIPGTLQQRFVALLEESLACMREYPAATRLNEAVQMEAGRHPEFGEALVARQDAEEKLYTRLIDDAVRHGELAEDVDRQALSDMLTSLTWGLTHLAATVSRDRHAAAIRQFEALLVSGSLGPRRA
ncbi:TetR/AcrR family transcriptional regulator [Streptomyces sp. NPDC091271]|uniref:TetR/AcrR family transcriptional regulator n=1 Tax=Streptomyces sp. NPDC091271 TaxID=3365980 RepID=UPI00380E39E7